MTRTVLLFSSLLVLSVALPACKKDKKADPAPTPPTTTPTIAAITPSNGAVGDVIDINGANLATISNTTVKFNGVPVTSYSNFSKELLTVVVPPGATTGDVVVTTSAGTSAGVPFVVLPASTYRTRALTDNGRKWKASADVLVTPSGTTNTYATYPACKKDDFYAFRADHTFTFDATPVPCGAGEAPLAGTWQFSTDLTKLLLTQNGLSVTFNILALDDTQLKLLLVTDSGTPGLSNRQTLTLKAF